MKKTCFRLLAALLLFSVCASLLPAPIFAVSEQEIGGGDTPTLTDFIAGTATAEEVAGKLDEDTVPAAVGYDEAVAKNHIARLYEDEGTDLYKVIFLNIDGTKTMYTFDHPVKYVDENGNIQDIRLEIADSTTDSGAFETAAGDAITTFSANFADGVALEGNDTEIRLIPVLPSANSGTATLTASNTAVATATAQRVDENKVVYPYDSETVVEYSLTYTGFKEDIVVSQYTGQTEYPFRLQTNGLALEEIDGSFFLVDGDGNIRASIGDIIIFTADERNNAFGDMEATTITENQEYLLNIIVDADYLADPATVYPIRIDPTVKINYEYGEGAVEDITVSTNTVFSGTYGYLFVGRRETEGIARTLLRFPGLDLSGLEGATVTDAHVRIRDVMCEDDPLDVSCHIFTGAEWSESTSTTWANCSPDSYVSTPLSTVTLKWSIGDTLSNKHWYQFDVTEAVQGWVDGNYSQSKGFLFKVANSIENGDEIQNRTFGSYNRTSYRPNLTVTYISPEDKLTVREGETYALPTDTLTGTATWESSNTVAATVDANGVVTGQKAGNAVITATVNGTVEREFQICVAIADGVYYLENYNSGYYLSVKDSDVLNGSVATQESQRRSAPEKYSQLWKITYLADGMYSIRPMHRLSTGLRVSSSAASILNMSTIDDASIVPTYCQWSIVFSAYGYVLRHQGEVAKTLVPTDRSTAEDATITVASPQNPVLSYIWVLTSVTEDIDNRVVFYDRKTKELTFEAVRYITPTETETCSDMQLHASFVSSYTNSQTMTWRAGDENAVSINKSTGTITGVQPGTGSTIVIEPPNNIAGESATYIMYVAPIPNGVYFLQNRAGSKQAGVLGNSFVAGASVEQWYYQDAYYQQWEFTHIGENMYTIRADATAVDLYLGVTGNSTTNGANIVLRSGAIEDGMIWEVVPVSQSSYKLIAKSSNASGGALAINAEHVTENGVALQQLQYVYDNAYNDEWHICSLIDIGMSTDDCTTGDCHDERGCFACANTFYNELYLSATRAPTTKIHHYNRSSIYDSASKSDFAVNGAISNNIDFMVYIGHGHEAHDSQGNHLHYDCGILETPHVKDGDVYTYCNPAGNVYTSEVKFGSSTSDLRWVWLYTCNFLTAGTYVTEDDLTEMMNGAHIIMGYASQSYICTPNAEKFGEYLFAGEPIIRAYFKAGHEGEAPYATSNHLQKVLFIPQTAQETIYSPFIRYEYDSSDVLYETHYIDAEYY